MVHQGKTGPTSPQRVGRDYGFHPPVLRVITCCHTCMAGVWIIGIHSPVGSIGQSVKQGEKEWKQEIVCERRREREGHGKMERQQEFVSERGRDVLRKENMRGAASAGIRHRALTVGWAEMMKGPHDIEKV